MFVILSEPGEGRSMYVELGIALALHSKFGRPTLYAMGPRDNESIFHYAPGVQSVTDVDELLQMVQPKSTANETSVPLQVRLEEYRALRAEMLDIMRDRVWGQATYSLMVAGILAFAFASNSGHRVPGLIFLMALALPFLAHAIWREHARIRMGNYLRAVVEPSIRGLGWEKYLAIWRSEYGEREGQGWLTLRRRSTHIFALSGLFLTTSMFALILLVDITDKALPLFLGSVLMFVLLVMYVYFFSLYDIGQAEYKKLEALDFKP